MALVQGSTSRLPTVSVCVVTYNHVAYIEDCVRSALDQHGDFDVRVLVGDDGSTDGTREVLRSLASTWPDRLVVHEHERNLGPSDNLRFLMAKATGDFVAHLDGDDFWLPGKLRRQLRHLLENPQIGAVYCNAVALGVDMAPVGFFNGAEPESFDTCCLLERGNFLSHSSMCYRASARPALLAIDGPLFDFRMNLRLSESSRLGYLNEVLVAYRVGAGASLTTGFSDVVAAMYWQAIEDVASRPDLMTSARICAVNFTANRLVESVLRADLRGFVKRLRPPEAVDRVLGGTLQIRALGQLALRILRRLLSGRWFRRTGSTVRILFKR